jgi:5-methylcytosine-specific restriction protein A
MRAPKICNGPGCINLMDPGERWCVICKPLHVWEGADKKRSGTAEHKREAAYVIDRDGHRCQLQYEGCLGVATEFDHYDHLNKSAGGNGACKDCHSKRSTMQGHAEAGHDVEIPPAPKPPRTPPSVTAPRRRSTTKRRAQRYNDNGGPSIPRTVGLDISDGEQC